MYRPSPRAAAAAMDRREIMDINAVVADMRSPIADGDRAQVRDIALGLISWLDRVAFR